MKLQSGAELADDFINASHFQKQEANLSTLWELVSRRVTAYLRPAFDEMKVLSNVNINRNIELLSYLLLSGFFDLEEGIVTVRREQVSIIQLAREEK